MQRDVTDGEQTTWSCVQAFSGTGDSAAARAAAERVAGEDGKVAVVCTPGGGAQSVRLELDPGWEESLSDDALLAAISDAREA